MPHMSEPFQPVQPVDGTVVPRYAGFSTFARLPRIGDVPTYDVAVVGIPFDAGVSYRPGARFGPAHIRQCSRVLRPYHPQMRVSPFATQQVVDAGDIACTPYDIAKAVGQIEEQASALIADGARLITIGGDHTIAYPLLRAHHRRYGPVALVHFDAHLDTWDTYFGAAYTHGTPFRRAAEEGILDPTGCLHVGIRGPGGQATGLVRAGEHVAGVAQLGQHDQAGALRRGVLHGPGGGLAVGVRVADDRAELGGGDQRHGVAPACRANRPRSS